MFAVRSTALHHTVGNGSIQPQDVFPLTPMVNKSCKIECCVNKIHQIVQDMILTQG